MIRLKTVLVPTDFSEPSLNALRYGCEFANRFEAELHVLHVIADPAVDHPEIGLSMLPITQFKEEIENAAGTKLNELPVLSEFPNIRIARHLCVGTAFVEIIRYAKEQNIDLIILGTHGRNALAQVLIGSVAERVVRKAPCPVLTVRHSEHEFVMPWAEV